MDLSSEEVSGSDSPIDPSQFASTFDVEIKVTFPGEIISTNGTVDGTTVSWSPQMGETVTMEALAKAEPAEGGILPLSPTSSSGGSSLLWPLLIGLLVAVLVAGVVAFLVMRGRRPAHAGAGEVPEGAAGYAPPPQYGQPQYPAQPYGQPQYPGQPQPYGQPQYPAQPEQPTQVLPPPAGPPAPPSAPPAAPPPAPPAAPPPAPPAQGPPPPTGPPVG
jgi:hypothetical protein